MLTLIVETSATGRIEAYNAKVLRLVLDFLAKADKLHVEQFGTPSAFMAKTINGFRSFIIETAGSGRISSLPYNAKLLRLALSVLTQIDELYIRTFGAPLIYESGVFYAEEPAGLELWPDIGRVMARGYGDCEDFACWRAAELRVKGDKRARAEILGHPKGNGVEYHVIVKRSNGSTEDPSALLTKPLAGQLQFRRA